MQIYKFRDIAEYLMHGREIEFTYKERECAITNHSKHWWFYDGVIQIELCEFKNFELLVNKVSKCVVEDKSIQEIFDNSFYDNIYIL